MFFFFSHSTKYNEKIAGLTEPIMCSSCNNLNYFIFVNLYKDKTLYWVFNYSSQYESSYILCPICQTKFEYNSKITLAYRDQASTEQFMNLLTDFMKETLEVSEECMKQFFIQMIDTIEQGPSDEEDHNVLSPCERYGSILKRAMNKHGKSLKKYKDHKEYKNMLNVAFFRFRKIFNLAMNQAGNFD